MFAVCIRVCLNPDATSVRMLCLFDRLVGSNLLFDEQGSVVSSVWLALLTRTTPIFLAARHYHSPSSPRRAPWAFHKQLICYTTHPPKCMPSLRKRAIFRIPNQASGHLYFYFVFYSGAHLRIISTTIAVGTRVMSARSEVRVNFSPYLLSNSRDKDLTDGLPDMGFDEP